MAHSVLTANPLSDLEVRAFTALAYQLVGDFLALERNGYRLPPVIALVGGQKVVRELLAREIAVQFIRAQRTDLHVQFTPVCLDGRSKYLIDVGYFSQRHHLETCLSTD